MKKLFLFFLLLLIAVGVGYLAHQDPGVAMISYRHWMVATSMWVAAGCVLILFFVFYFLVRVIKNILAIPAFFRRRRDRMRAENYRRCLSQSMIAMAVGDYKKAEKKALKAGTDYDTAYVNYLIAAQAAQAQQAYDRRDQYVEKALACGKDETFAILLTQAQLLLQSNEYDEALLILKRLYKQDQKNGLVLSALKMIYLKNKDSASLKLILPQLKKQKLIADDEMIL